MRNITAKMPDAAIAKLDEVQSWLQEDRPEHRVSRSDAIRWCIEVGNHSLSSSVIPSGISNVTLESVEKEKLSPVSRGDEDGSD